MKVLAFDANLGSKGGASTHQLSVAEIPSHNHNALNGGAFIQANNGTNAWQKITVSGSEQTWASFLTGASGQSNTHNNMPPYLALAFIIKT